MLKAHWKSLRDQEPVAGLVHEVPSSDLSSRSSVARRQPQGDVVRALQFALGHTTLGAFLVARSDKGLCAILLGDEPEALLHDLEARFPQARVSDGDASLETLAAKVASLIEAPALGADLPLDIRGTAFQCRVWDALRRIPPGETLSYTELARRINAPRAVRAVASACAANALAVVIPCHRVLRSDGGLSGYRWGVARKRALLEREKRDA